MRLTRFKKGDRVRYADWEQTFVVRDVLRDREWGDVYELSAPDPTEDSPNRVRLVYARTCEVQAA